MSERDEGDTNCELDNSLTDSQLVDYLDDFDLVQLLQDFENQDVPAMEATSPTPTQNTRKRRLSEDDPLEGTSTHTPPNSGTCRMYCEIYLIISISK